MFLNVEVETADTNPNPGIEVPIPTFPFASTVKSEVVANPAVVEDTENSGRVEPSVP